jgi:hypothetical protein
MFRQVVALVAFLAFSLLVAACSGHRPTKSRTGVMFQTTPQSDGTLELIVIGDLATGHPTIQSDGDRDALIAKAADSQCVEEPYEIVGPVETSLGDGIIDSRIHTRYRVRIRCLPTTAGDDVPGRF